MDVCFLWPVGWGFGMVAGMRTAIYPGSSEIMRASETTFETKAEKPGDRPAAG